MKKKLFFISSLLCLMVQGTWAQTAAVMKLVAAW